MSCCHLVPYVITLYTDLDFFHASRMVDSINVLIVDTSRYAACHSGEFSLLDNRSNALK